MGVGAILSMIPWRLIAKVLWGVALRPLIKMAVEKSETKVDDKFFEQIDKVISNLLGVSKEQDAKVMALIAEVEKDQKKSDNKESDFDLEC